MRNVVIFDLGNVLIDFDPRPAYRDHYEGDEEALQHFFESRTMWDILANGHDTLESWDSAFDDFIARRPELKSEVEVFRRDWAKFVLGPMEPSLDLFHRLRNNNVGLYALTNWPAQVWPPFSHPEHQHDYSFLDHFEDIVVSGIEQLKKPNPEFYQLALNRWGLEPERCIFVDDLEENIEAANRLGILGHHFTSADRLEQELLSHGLL